MVARIRDIPRIRAIFRGGGLRGRQSGARARRSMKRLNLGCADRRQKPGARRPDHRVGRRGRRSGRRRHGRTGASTDRPTPPTRRASAARPRPRFIPSPRRHPRLTRPRPSPATVPQASEARSPTRIGRVKLNVDTSCIDTPRAPNARARVCPRPRHHDSRHGDATDIRAAHRRSSGPKSRWRVRSAPSSSARRRAPGGANEAPTRARRRATRRGARRVLLDVPRRTNAEHHSKGYRSRDGSRKVGGGAAPRTVRRRFGERFGERNRDSRNARRGERCVASDPRVADKIGLRDGDGVRSFDKDTTSPHHNTSHSLVSPAHLVFLKRLGATHLSMHPHMSKYCPVQCASPVVSFSTRATHASYAAMNFAHLGLHASSRSGL